MFPPRRVVNQVLRRVRGQRVPIWYDADYRLPVAAIAGTTGVEPRRADYVVWYLLDDRIIYASSLRTPRRIRYGQIARVHTPELIESLSRPETLARIFAASPGEIPVDELMSSVRLACGATLEAAREALRRRGPTMNLLGGFHHAEPDRAGGLCPINDIAIAVAALRAESFAGRVAVLDLDAPPPDGTAACLAADARAWIGSISGEDWGPLEGVDEVRLPADSGDGLYLDTLAQLLRRMRRPDLVFVVAGGDVLAGDRMGKLGLTLAGARERDLRVRDALVGVPSVWLPGGGYSEAAWRVLAGTAMALELGSRRPVPRHYEPMRRRFAVIAAGLDAELLDGGEGITAADLDEALGLGSSERARFLGYYTREGLEYGLFRYGILEQVYRLGYAAIRLSIDRDPNGERLRLFAQAAGREHLLAELVLQVQRSGTELRFLYVHWLTLMNPLGGFSDDRPQLPGQETPGLGLVREALEVLAQMARRLGLDGVSFRPAWYHIAYTGRQDLHFVDPRRQGRFEAMLRDLGHLPLLAATKAVAAGQVLLDGEPYTWEADEMVYWLDRSRLDRAAIDRERQRARFSLRPRPTGQARDTSSD